MASFGPNVGTLMLVRDLAVKGKIIVLRPNVSTSLQFIDRLGNKIYAIF